MTPVRTLMLGRALRAFGDGYAAVLLPAYLLALGLGPWEVGALSTATLLGSALSTLAVGAWGHRLAHAHLLSMAALLMAATGLGFASLSGFWPLLLVAFVGTLNPGAGDVSVFMPLEHDRLAGAAQGQQRAWIFARYSLAGTLLSAVGALAAAVPQWVAGQAWSLPPGSAGAPVAVAAGIGVGTSAGAGSAVLSALDAMRAMFVLYGVIGLALWWLYRRMPQPAREPHERPAPLGPSRSMVVKLATLFSVDSFASGLTVNALLALWLFERFGMSVGAAGQFFFWSGLCSAASQLVAPVLSRRIGLVNTMVLTHIPASLCLVAAAFAPSQAWALGLLIARSLLSQMDVPARSAFVMSVVTPGERAAAASFTSVPRGLASAVGPMIGGALFASGWMAAPLVACGLLKVAYDLALWRGFRRVSADG